MSRNNQDSAPQPSKPAAPPPPYTEFAARPSSSSSLPLPSSSGSHPSFIPNPPSPQQPRHNQNAIMFSPDEVPYLASHHPGYGPTPLATNQPLLPYAYYEARGSADARARSRFISAFIYAVVVVWLVIMFAASVEVFGEKGWLWNVCVRKLLALDRIVRFWLWMKMTNSAVEFV